MRRYADIVVIVIAIAWCVVGVAMVLFGAGCQVYEEPPPCGRAHPGGGVPVRYAELADDGGFE
jgi:hypothetical protein